MGQQTLGTQLLSAVSYVVFALLDIFDQLLCPVFAFLDSVLESKPASCYCHQAVCAEQDGKVLNSKNAKFQHLNAPCDTIFGKRHKSGRDRLHFLTMHRSLSRSASSFGEYSFENETYCDKTKSQGNNGLHRSHTDKYWRIVEESQAENNGNWRQQPGKKILSRSVSWSDCNCKRCTAWQVRPPHLHVVVDDKDFARNGDPSANNIIFIHGFLASTAFWTETVIPHLPESVRAKNRIFTVDLMGFGKSPRPADCLYTIGDHVESIQRSVLWRYGIRSFHLVGHSMGCTIALALAAQDPTAVKSITIIAPPYFPAEPGAPPGQHFLRQVAPRTLWPIMTFTSSVMSWYEHIGRLACLVICKNHRLWEPILQFLLPKLLGNSLPTKCVQDFMQHNHSSAWHIFHNTICNGAYNTDQFVKVLMEAGQRVRVIHGVLDATCPLQCALDLSSRYPNVHLTEVPGETHIGVVVGREKQLVLELQEEFNRCLS